MKVRVASKEPSVQIGDSGLTGKPLVLEEDQVGYTCYDVVLDDGSTLDIKSAFGSNFNHIYYCVYGEILFECSEGTTETLKTDHLIALTGAMTAKIKTNSKTCLFITYTKKSEEGPQPEKAFYYTLDKIKGTERDVDWFHGRSRRYLRQAEGFNVSVTNTLVYAETISPMHYINHKETTHYIEGHVQLTWDEGKGSHEFHQVDHREGHGTSITMDKNDSHIVYGKSFPSICLCVFYPALKGDETHDFSKTVSSY